MPRREDSVGLGDHLHDLVHFGTQRAVAVCEDVDRLLGNQIDRERRELQRRVLAVVLDVLRRGDRREPHDLPAHRERHVDRVRVEPADLRVERDASVDVDAGCIDSVRLQSCDVGGRVVVVRLDDDRTHPGVGRPLRGLGRVQPARERRRIRMDVEIDGAVEDAIDELAHVATSNVWRPYPMIRCA